MSNIVIDSSAWIEYFAGTKKGLLVRSWVQKPGMTIFTTGLIVSEVCTKFLKDSQPIDTLEEMFTNLTVLQQFDYALGIETAKIYVKERKSRPKFGLADAHVLAAARRSRAKVITCDHDFSGVSEAVVIE